MHDAYTPRHLVDEVLGRRKVLEGERKPVTIFFVDVVDSVQHSSSMGMELWHFALNGLFRLLTEGVHRFGGVVNQYTGDGVMALFGAPTAYEDHAARACFAALHLHDRIGDYASETERRLGESFGVRMALHSGEVVVGPIGDELRMDYTAQGTVVGIAARLESIAEPGSILVSASTADLVSGFVTTEPLGDAELKGIEQPIAYCRLVGRGSVEDRFTQARERGLTHFCGREAELEWLHGLLDQSRAHRPIAVGLQGDAGVGKSRLLHEFSRMAREQGAVVLELRGVTHRQLAPFESLAPLVRRLLGLRPGDEDDAGLEARLREVAPELCPSLRALLGARSAAGSSEPAADAEERGLLRLLRRLLHDLGQTAPVIVELDDVDWLDEASQRLLGNLAASMMNDEPVLWLLCQREGSPGSRVRQGRYEERRIEPLPDTAAALLAELLLGDDDSVVPLRAALLERCAGNPYFLEEMVRSLLEAGHLSGLLGARVARPSWREGDLPGSVQAVLGARIDRLPDLEKHVLHAAAIVGREFTEGLVRELTELSAREVAGALHQLRLADFVEERWFEAEPTYSFSHPLVQEVAYHRQLSVNRELAHRRVAEIIAIGQGDDAAAAGRKAAPHWERAGEPLRAAQAWAASASLGSVADRIETWRRVVGQLERAGDGDEARTLGTSACAQLLSLGWHHGITRETARELLERGQALMRGDDREGVVRAILTTYHCRLMLGLEDADTYAEAAADAQKEADNAGWELVRDGVDALMAQALLYAGRLPEALAQSEATIPALAARQASRFESSGFQITPDLWVRSIRGEILALMGRGREGREALEQVLAEAAERDEVELLVLPRFNLIRSHWLEGEPLDLREGAEDVLRTATQLASERAVIMAKAGVGIAAHLAGDATSAAKHLVEAIDRIRDRRTGTELEPLLEAHLAAARTDAGAFETALAAADAAVATSRERHFRVFEGLAQIERARASAALGRDEDARAARRRGEALIEETSAEALRRRLDETDPER